MPISPALAQLVHRCHAASRVPWWTQGAGSNLSVKEGHSLWIKASGKRLDAVDAASGVAALDLLRLRAQLVPLLSAKLPATEADAAYRATLSACRLPGYAAPSMETAMHALLPGRDVLHLHALVAMVLAEQHVQDPRGVAERLCRAGLSFRVVPAVLPGWALAEAVAAEQATDVLLLRNHGLILQGDADALLRKWRALEDEWLGEQDAAATHAWAAQAMASPWIFSPAPWFASTPDVAVFAAQIHAVTQAMPDGKRRLMPDAMARDRNAAELWASHLALCQLAPQLPALPSAFVHSVGALPQEKLRHAQIAADTHHAS